MKFDKKREFVTVATILLFQEILNRLEKIEEVIKPLIKKESKHEIVIETKGYSKEQESRIAIETHGLSNEEFEILHRTLIQMKARRRFSKEKKYRETRHLHYKLVKATPVISS